MSDTIFLSQPVCATCVNWGGPRRPNLFQGVVNVDSFYTVGYCGYCNFDKEAITSCGGYEPLKR